MIIYIVYHFCFLDYSYIQDGGYLKQIIIIILAFNILIISIIFNLIIYKFFKILIIYF